MNALPLQAFVQTVHWPVMPEVGQRLVHALDDEDTDAPQLCRILRADPALSATVLRMANSAMFGQSSRVDSLERAVAVVGLSQIRARALALCLSQMAPMPAGLDRQTFWRWSLRCAGYAQWLAQPCGVDAGQAWLSGVLLRLGELNLGHVQPLALPRIEARPCQPAERWARERQLCGHDEAAITAELVLRWDFPTVLVDALRASTHPLGISPFSRLGACVHLAARLADCDPARPQCVHDLPVMVLRLLALDADALATQLPDPERLIDPQWLF